MSFTNILVPTDLSPCSDAATATAAGLAKSLGARITLMHVVDVQVPLYSDSAAPPLVQLRADAEAKARAALDAKARDLPDHTVSTVVCVGPTWREILDFAEREAIDLVVIGTHGRTGLSRFLIGSTTEKVVRMATIPVLVVHAAAPE